jgi:hypothetical protein
LTGEVTIVSKTLDIRIDVPKDVSDQAARFAEAKAKEAAVIALQQAGELTSHEAAEQLGLSDEDYRNLLASDGLFFFQAEKDGRFIERAREEVGDQLRQLQRAFAEASGRCAAGNALQDALRHLEPIRKPPPIEIVGCRYKVRLRGLGA